ncbi:MAG: 50S ribosomal protein L31e [Candidatus Woesearchaeota archaeon]
MERTYNIPLRREFQKVAKHRRAKRAIAALRAFISKHMKSADIRIGKHLNQHIWEQGMRNPPHHVKVNLTKEDSGIVKAELFGKKYEELTKEDIEKLREKAEKKPEKAKSEKPETSAEPVKEKPEKPEKTEHKQPGKNVEKPKTNAEPLKVVKEKSSQPDKPKTAKTEKPASKPSLRKRKTAK